METLQTSRLKLRSWTSEDLDDLFEYAKTPDVGPNAGWPPHASKLDSQMILERFIKSDDVWAIEHKEHRKVIGSFGLHKDSKRSGVHCKMIGYVLAKPYWGQGLMHEAVDVVLEHAFSLPNVTLISVYHYPMNVRSRRVIEKSGFIYEGIMRQASEIFDGTIYDDVCYSLTKEEYLNRAKKTQ